jgi:cytochrome d ubiquinol oxidase subunit II
LAYAIVMPALYAPFIIMLLALVFRGVAFEYRWRDKSHERIWDTSFVFGSFMATFMQGIVLGTFVQGIEVEGRAYAGGWWDWLTPFTVMTGLALCLGYSLLGSGWLILKTEGRIRDQAYRFATLSAIGTFFFVCVVSLWTPFLSPEIYDRWFTIPHLYFVAPVPLLTLLVAGIIARGIYKRIDNIVYPGTIALLGLCFVGLGVGLTPYIVPRAVTIHEAAAPDSSLLFMLVGALIMLPLILGYTSYSYWIFRGKVRHGDGGYHS